MAFEPFYSSFTYQDIQLWKNADGIFITWAPPSFSECEFHPTASQPIMDGKWAGICVWREPVFSNNGCKYREGIPRIRDSWLNRAKRYSRPWWKGSEVSPSAHFKTSLRQFATSASFCSCIFDTPWAITYDLDHESTDHPDAMRIYGRLTCCRDAPHDIFGKFDWILQIERQIVGVEC